MITPFFLRDMTFLEEDILHLGTFCPGRVTLAMVTSPLEFPVHHLRTCGRGQQLLGHMTSLEKLVLRGRLHMRPLQFCLKEQWNSVTQPPGHLEQLATVDAVGFSLGLRFRHPFGTLSQP